MELSSPGDRDKRSDLRSSDPDFFTRDLDDALLEGRIDLAVHSAKDLPDSLREGVDFLWLPWREDPRDVLILRKGGKTPGPDARLKAGISSARREEYCAKRFPNARQLPVRGNIGERVAQLDAGNFDLLIMAAAGLARLGLEGRISEYIPVEELEPPAGQGYLALTFRAGDETFRKLRLAFAKPVVFAGAGPGSKGLITKEAADAIARCEVCLYDSLIDESLTELAPKGAKLVFVGKRKGGHSVPQERICAMIADFARQGKRVVRLKGGDPGVFGRLAEEVETLEGLGLPYKVVPGISSFLAATTGTGLLLTRRGVSRGFTALTPRKAASSEFEPVPPEERAKLPLVFFMGASEAARICSQLIAEGRAPSMPAALVLGAGTKDVQAVTGTLKSLPGKIKKLPPTTLPGLVIVGEPADGKYLYKRFGALAGKRVLLVCSETVMAKAARAVEDFAGTPVELPMAKLIPDFKAIDALPPFEGVDWLLASSPSSAKFLLERLVETGSCLRKLPKIMTCGAETSREFRRFGIVPDAEPKENFSAEAIVECAKLRIEPGERVLRLRSDIAGNALAKSLRKLGISVSEAVIYRNERIARKELPAFDMAFFSSPSNVVSFVESFGADALSGVPCMAIGEPTLEALKRLCPEGRASIPSESTAQDAIRELAWGQLSATLAGTP